jgi:phosphoglycolate phosphatase
MIGDSDVDIITAKNAGMVGIGCGWGYRGADMLRACGADAVVDRPSALSELLCNPQ